jgi:hypothetical protein
MFYSRFIVDLYSIIIILPFSIRSFCLAWEAIMIFFMEHRGHLQIDWDNLLVYNCYI